MNFISRAWLYIIRKKGKSILLFIILLVMATFVLTALALGNASNAAQMELRKSLGGSFLIGFDYTENNPYLKVESVDGGTLVYSTQQISPELVEQVRSIDGVNYCSATTESLAVLPSLDLFAGNIPIEEEFRNSSKILGTWKSEELSRFTSGQLALTEGRHIMPGDKNKGLISKDLADKNGLKIGDVIQTDKGVEIEIVGLFVPKEIEGINDQVTTYDKIQNLIISDLATRIANENSPATQGFNELTVSVDDPQNMENIITKVKEIKGVDWKGFAIMVDNEGYENAAFSLQQLSELVSTILIVVLIVSVVILSLILTLWSRTRVHETGILLSLGIRKLSILGQYIAEVLIIAVLAFSLSYFSSNAIAGQMGTILQPEQSAANVQVEEDGISAGSRGEAGTDMGTQEIEMPQLQVTVQIQDMGVLFLIGLGIVTVSAGISSISVMRLKPREILSKMS
ncbi:FtsX-like permease family protein [Lawsonibacter hominis]|uniref:ABC transporter permease n=1 Tax=Lawsonibacter hominis TaxID=2763053 RepID=A0A8J6J8M1_9FIRM|nr:ABC transporter permease [Lawsonibacter hominis]MBC5734846.1 ABC transporter permease [Lawsonibacter hominis]